MFKFGFKLVQEEEKKGLVSSLFNSVASKYDVMNNVMSFGLQKAWKNNFVDLIELKDGGRYLDLASGNGDISALLLKKAQNENKNIELVLCDASNQMLELAKVRFASCLNVSFALSFAEELPFQEEEFDGIFISFGIRNFTNIESAISRIHASLKRGGNLFVLEFFSDVSNNFAFNKIYKQYLLKGIPLMGKIITKNEDAYKYFGESILNFYSTDEFEGIIERVGFKAFSKNQTLLSIATFFHFKKY